MELGVGINLFSSLDSQGTERSKLTSKLRYHPHYSFPMIMLFLLFENITWDVSGLQELRHFLGNGNLGRFGWLQSPRGTERILKDETGNRRPVMSKK